MSNLNLTEICFIWNNFIKQIIEFTSKNEIERIYDINNKINIQGNDEDLIKMFTNFYDENINNFIKIMIISKDQYKTCLFFKNIKRMSKLLNVNILNEENIYTQLLKIYISIVEDRNSPPYKEKIKSNIIDYCNDINPIFLENIFKKAIKYKQYGILDKIKHHINLYIFIKEEYTNKSIQHILKMKGDKLINYLN